MVSRFEGRIGKQFADDFSTITSTTLPYLMRQNDFFTSIVIHSDDPTIISFMITEGFTEQIVPDSTPLVAPQLPLELVCQLRNTDTTTDLHGNGIIVPIGGIVDIADLHFTVVGNGIRTDWNGRVRISIHMDLDLTSNDDIKFNVRRNGVLLEPRLVESTAAAGHTKQSGGLTFDQQCQVGDVFDIWAEQDGGNGPVTMAEVGSSVFLMTRID